MFNQHRTRTRAIQGVIDISTSGALKYPSLIVSEDTRLKSMRKWILRDLEYKMDWFAKMRVCHKSVTHPLFSFISYKNQKKGRFYHV